jgi:hypothetical protein
MFSQRLGEALETAVATMALEPVDRLSTIEDRVSMLLGEQVLSELGMFRLSTMVDGVSMLLGEQVFPEPGT